MSISEEMAIHCTELSKSYGTVMALKNLNLSVHKHSIFGLLGPNGAGKSTTIKLLTRQIAPSSGQAWVSNKSITGRQGDVRYYIGYLSEQPAFYSWMSGTEFLDFVGELFGLSKQLRHTRSNELLELVGLTEAAKRKIGGYSQGMRQRLGIAQALINQPEVLFLDEPVSALDPIGRKEVLEMLEGFRGKMTVFLSSHILADIDRICDQVAVLNHGELLVQASTMELKERFAQSSISVELEEDASPLEHLSEQESYVERVEVRGKQATIFVSDLNAAKKSLPQALINTQTTLLHYEVALPTLEDVFVHLIEERENKTGAKK